MKKILMVIIFSILGLGIIIGNYYWDMNTRLADEGLFSDIILDRFKEENFHSFSTRNSEYEYKKIIDEEITNEILNYFKGFELKEVTGRSYSYDYYINFKNQETRENLGISIMDEKHIEVRVQNMDKEVKKVNEILTETHWKDEIEEKYYEITNGKIDLEFMEEFFNELEE